MPIFLKNSLLLISLFTIVSYGEAANSQHDTDKAKSYHYQIAIKYIQLVRIRRGFGETLISGETKDIYLAANAVVDALNEMKYEIEAMEVPEQIKEPYDVFLISINAYKQSAKYLQTAMGILIGIYDGTRVDVEQLIDKSENFVVMGNKYFGLSIVMHEELSGFYTECPDEFENYARKFIT